MRFYLTGDQRKFFDNERYIEFENCFKKEQIAQLSDQVDQVLFDRNPKLIHHPTPKDLFQISRDVWRSSQHIEKFICSRKLIDIVSQLFMSDSIYVAADDVFRTFDETGFNPYPNEKLQNFSCIQPLLCTVIIHLKGSSTATHLIPKNSQNIVIFAPDYPVPWDQFFKEPQQSFLLVSYAPKTALYLLNLDDPRGQELKKLGYVFGDRLKPNLNPFLYSTI